MSDALGKLVTLDVLSPGELAVVYPGVDAWVQLERATAVPSGPGPNALVNPGFEDTDMSQWGPSFSGVAVSRSTAEFHSDAASAQVIVSDLTAPQTSKGIFTGPVSMPGGTLRAVAWVKGTAGAALTLNIYTGAWGFEASVSATATGAWQRMTVDYAAPGASTHMFWVATSTLGTFFVDDCEFRPLAGTDLAWLQLQANIQTPPAPGDLPWVELER